MRSIHHRCPCCLTRTLVPVSASYRSVLECRQCQGVWFEDGALNRVIAANHDDIDHYDHEANLGGRLRTSDRQCRRCDVAMEHHQLLTHYQTEIDCCPGCDGVWLDRHEIDQVLHSPKLAEALEALNQKVGWKSWVFQFLTHMPVEYNLPARRLPLVTLTLIVLCSLIFIAGQLDAKTDRLFFEAAGFNSASWWHAPWQLLGYQFLHGGWMHLLGNMYFLWIIGDNLEDVLGHWRFLGLYLLSGTVAALAELALFDSSQGPLLLVGASGSIAALFGLYLVWFRHASLTFMFVVYQKKLAPHWYFLIWSAINFIGMAAGSGGVAYAAHLGGFAFGLAAGVLLKPGVYRRNPLIAMLNRPEARIAR